MKNSAIIKKTHLFFLIAIIMSYIHGYAQSNYQLFYSQHYLLFLSDSGTYILGDPMSDIAVSDYLPQHIYSFGSYRKEGRYYVLNADKTITDNQGECKFFFTQYGNVQQKDSMIFYIKSPYEEKVNKKEYNRIFSYTLNIRLSNGVIVNVTDTMNRFSIEIEDSIFISNLKLYITHCPDFYRRGCFYSFTHSPYCYIQLDTIPLDSNSVTIKIPSFDYFSLSYVPYRNYRFKILNKHQIFSEGEIFTKLDRKRIRYYKRMERMSPIRIKKLTERMQMIP